MKIDGACHCGYITIEGEADPEKTQVCHCTDCQTGTGSAFRVSVPVPGASFKMSGQPTNYTKTTADSGNPRVQAFCPGLRPHYHLNYYAAFVLDSDGHDIEAVCHAPA
jgi:hypothetical protein